MNKLLLLGAGGVGLFELFRLWGKPNATKYQVTPVGNGVKVATPVPAAVTPGQKAGVSTSSSASAPKVAVATSVPGQGLAYAPPKSVTATSSGTQAAPIVITPAGASSVAIASTLDVQRALNTLGYMPNLKEDGVLGPDTTNNIKQFQGKNSLVVDGSAGPATKAALSTALAHLASVNSQLAALTPGSGSSSGNMPPPGVTDASAVTPVVINSAKDVQNALNTLGTSPALVVDGDIGPKSVAAIKSFQMAHGLASDGIAGPATKTALGLAVAITQAGGSASPSTPSVGWGFGFGRFGRGVHHHHHHDMPWDGGEAPVVETAAGPLPLPVPDGGPFDHIRRHGEYDRRPGRFPHHFNGNMS